MTDHDLLIKLLADMDWIRTMLTNHLQSHWTISCLVIGALVSGGGALVVSILTGRKWYCLSRKEKWQNGQRD